VTRTPATSRGAPGAGWLRVRRRRSWTQASANRHPTRGQVNATPSSACLAHVERIVGQRRRPAAWMPDVDALPVLVNGPVDAATDAVDFTYVASTNHPSLGDGRSGPHRPATG
jgi:hypothetical protein